MCSYETVVFHVPATGSFVSCFYCPMDDVTNKRESSSSSQTCTSIFFHQQPLSFGCGNHPSPCPPLPSPLKAITYDHVLTGRDIIGKSRTGTGKTIAFGLPVVQHLGRFAEDHKERTYQRGRSPRFLVVCPTRELARQVCGGVGVMVCLMNELGGGGGGGGLCRRLLSVAS